MANSEGITKEIAEAQGFIGHYRNFWRQRWVTIYKHPTDPAKLLSVGYPLTTGGSADHSKEAIVCVECYDHMKGRIENNDWRDYH